MSNKEKYMAIFTSVFYVSPAEAIGLEYRSIDAWDSAGHMSLVASLEETFDIMMDTEDIIAFSSYEKGMEI